MKQTLHALALLALASGCACGEEATPAPPRVAPPPEVPAEAPPPDETDYGRALAALEARLEAAERSSDVDPPDWIRLEGVAANYEARAGLTGDYADYVRAEEWYARAFAAAGEGSGPLLGRAHLHFTLHRLERAEADLATLERAAIPRTADQTMSADLRADLAFHRGQFEEAARAHRAAEERAPNSTTAFRIAYDLWQRAEWNEAERWLTTAEARVPDADAQGKAWMNLQMGLMDLDRGRCADALAHYQRADELFSGWWLVHEHIAETHACLGNLEEAERMYRDVVERTGNPELIGALAGVLDERGQTEEAARVRAQATEAFERQLAQVPEAAYGHALEHFLEVGPPARALELARANYALRPGGEATVRLAQALLLNDGAEEARALLEPILAGPYRTADVHATAHEVFTATGDTARAAEQATRAREIDPRAIPEASPEAAAPAEGSAAPSPASPSAD